MTAEYSRKVARNAGDPLSSWALAVSSSPWARASRSPADSGQHRDLRAIATRRTAVPGVQSAVVLGDQAGGQRARASSSRGRRHRRLACVGQRTGRGADRAAHRVLQLPGQGRGDPGRDRPVPVGQAPRGPLRARHRSRSRGSANRVPHRSRPSATAPISSPDSSTLHGTRPAASRNAGTPAPHRLPRQVGLADRDARLEAGSASPPATRRGAGRVREGIARLLDGRSAPGPRQARRRARPTDGQRGHGVPGQVAGRTPPAPRLGARRARPDQAPVGVGARGDGAMASTASR